MAGWGASEARPELIPQQLERFRQLIEDRTGIYYPDYRRDALQRALAARLIRSGAADWGDYYRRLVACAGGGDEFRQLLRHITISETAFFRVPSQFEALRSVVVPAIIAQRGTGTLSIWSAGCSTGEEPYSIAITLAEMGTALRGWQVRILATDVSAEAVERARRGCYQERALRGVPAGRLGRYFCRRPDGYELRPDVRERVAFEEFNLAYPRYPRPAGDGWDIIFCRNVTMYFRPETARQVVARFRDVLRPGGFLVLSPTESLCSICDDFETIEAAGAFIHVKPPLLPALAEQRRTGSPARPAAPAPASRGLNHRAALTLSPTARAVGPNEDEACSRAIAAVAADDWEQAEQALGPFAGEARSVRPRLLLAWLSAMRGEAEVATELCQELLARDPLLGPAHYALGLVASRAGDLDESAEHFGKAVYSDDGLVPAYYHLGVTQCSRRDLAAARGAFRGALRALDRGAAGWLDYAEGLSADHWRRACAQRLAGLAGSE